MTREEVVEIIREEIENKLVISLENTGFETLGLRVTVEYDDSLISMEDV